MNSFSPGPDGERGVNLPEQANALVELGLRNDLRISPHKRACRKERFSVDPMGQYSNADSETI
jgi:hypothetical protein